MGLPIGGCGCCSCTNFKVKVLGNCTGTPIAGASVTVNGVTETTDSSGEATFTSAKIGLTITVAATGFNTSGSSTVPSNCVEVTVTLHIASGYTCCGGECPFPSTITGTDANQSFTMTRTTLGGHTVYCGGYTIAATVIDPSSCDTPTTTTSDVPILYIFDCTDGTISFRSTASLFGASPPYSNQYWEGSVSGCTITLTNTSCGHPPFEDYVWGGCSGSNSIAGWTGTWCPLNLTVPLLTGTYDCGVGGSASGSPFLGGSSLTLTP